MAASECGQTQYSNISKILVRKTAISKILVRKTAIFDSGSKSSGAQIVLVRKYANRFWGDQTQRPSDMPPSMVSLADNHALCADTHVQTFEGVSDRDMRDFIG
jgi:hypothetical protein